MSQSLTFSLVIVVSSTCALSSASAESDIRSQLLAGEHSFARGDFQRALEAFESAFNQEARPGLLYNIAMCLWELDEIPRSVNTFRLYLRIDAENIQETDRQEINELIDRMAPHFGDVVFENTFPSSSLFVDGEPFGSAPLPEPLAFPPGIHSFSLETNSGDTVTVRTTVESGRLNVVSFPSPQRPSGGVVSESETSGEDRLSFVRSSEVFQRPRWWLWTSVGLTAATTLGAVVTGSLTLEARSTYLESHQLDIEAYDRGQSLALATDVLIGIAAGMAVVMTIALVVHVVRHGGSRSISSRARSSNLGVTSSNELLLPSTIQ